ncbi:hypothetical protein [Streptomyces malaysiensis]|uniref:hypothetical protein n=1 Tax=Streptomyces malaysiensis TaxID=92644 RepID=UPI002B2C7719|nr:hypothetical protein R8789_19025 [Streptomyces malaysiensis]
MDVEVDGFNLVMRPADPAMAAVVEAEETKGAAEAAEKEAAAASPRLHVRSPAA